MQLPSILIHSIFFLIKLCSRQFKSIALDLKIFFLCVLNKQLLIWFILMNPKESARNSMLGGHVLPQWCIVMGGPNVSSLLWYWMLTFCAQVDISGASLKVLPKVWRSIGNGCFVCVGLDVCDKAYSINEGLQSLSKFVIF